MATGKAIESIWSGDVVTWYLPTNYKDVPYPPCGALKAWAVDAGLRDGDKIVLHHVASAGEVVSRPDGVRDRAISIRRTTKTASMSGYMVVTTPEWAQLPTDVATPGPTTEWLMRRGVGSAVVASSTSDGNMESLPPLSAAYSTPVQYNIPEGAIINGCPLPAGLLTADEVAAACGGTVVDGVVQVPLANNGDSRLVIEEPVMDAAYHNAIDMIAHGEGEVLWSDAASYLRITPEQVEQLIDEGALVARRIGYVWWVDAASVAKLKRNPLHDIVDNNKTCSFPGPFGMNCERKYNECRTADPRVHEGGGYRWDCIGPVTRVADNAPVSTHQLRGTDAYFAGDSAHLEQATLPAQDECPDTAMFVALDNANERLHGDIARLNSETSTLRQCLGRLQGVIEVKTGVDVSEHMNDPMTLTKALIAALMQSRKPYLAPIATTLGGNEIATAAEATTNAPTPIDDQLLDRVKAAGDDLKTLLHEMDAPRVAATTEANFFFGDLDKNHREPG